MSLKTYRTHYDYDIDDKQFKFWYQARPYCFRVNTRKKNEEFSFYLPINPTNLTVATHFATNVIATAYGTVEEHSEQRYFDIVIAGTTGMAPKNYDISIEKEARDANVGKTATGSWLDKIRKTAKSVVLGDSTSNVSGRASHLIFKSKLDEFGFFNRTKALIQNIATKAVDLFGIGDDEGAKSGIDYSKSGYIAFHNFYRFLLAYKKEVLGKDNSRKWDGKKHPIRFINYKDNNQYNVAIQTFQLTRSVDDPMLYRYNIVMRGYNLSKIDKTIDVDDTQKIKDLGLDSVKSISIKALLSNKARDAKNVLSSTIAAAKGFGS